jgi:hypothetical protein
LKSVGQCLSGGSTPPTILANGAERMTTIDESRGAIRDTAVYVKRATVSPRTNIDVGSPTIQLMVGSAGSHA